MVAPGSGTTANPVPVKDAVPTRKEFSPPTVTPASLL
jgi:hypothetical protein